MIGTENQVTFFSNSLLPDGGGGFVPCPDLMTEDELIRYLRVPEISKAGDFHNVIAQLKRFADLPCIHISRQPLYPRVAINEWIKNRVGK